MFRSKVKSRYRKSRNSRFYQGDILKDLKFVVGAPEQETELDLVELKYAVIMSQDCDIEHDFKSRKEKKDHDKYLRSLLVCPAFDLEEFANGIHFGDWAMKKFPSKKVDKLKNNDEYKRYHYLPSNTHLLIPELILDFKHFFTLPRDFLYKKKGEIYIASLNEIFREELSQRFSNYLSRIGLPEL
jgi:hypothetical protein